MFTLRRLIGVAKAILLFLILMGILSIVTPNNNYTISSTQFEEQCKAANRVFRFDDKGRRHCDPS
jgi:hypothetical protein